MAITIHPQYCTLPAMMAGERLKFLEVEADTLEEAEQAWKSAARKGWLNFMGGIATDTETGKPSLVLFKRQ